MNIDSANILNQDNDKLKATEGTHYYQLEGLPAIACNYLSLPVKTFEELFDGWESLDRQQRILNVVLAIILVVPTVFGLGACKIIHFFTAEKIDQHIYTYEWAFWVKEKKFWNTCINNCYSPFIDFCIKNRIRAEDCPFKWIGAISTKTYTKHHLFSSDAPFFRAPEFSNKGKDFLVVAQFHSRSGDMKNNYKSLNKNINYGFVAFKTEYIYAQYSIDWVNSTIQSIKNEELV